MHILRQVALLTVPRRSRVLRSRRNINRPFLLPKAARLTRPSHNPLANHMASRNTMDNHRTRSSTMRRLMVVHLHHSKEHTLLQVSLAPHSRSIHRRSSTASRWAILVGSTTSSPRAQDLLRFQLTL